MKTFLIKNKDPGQISNSSKEQKHKPLEYMKNIIYHIKNNYLGTLKIVGQSN